MMRVIHWAIALTILMAGCDDEKSPTPSGFGGVGAASEPIEKAKPAEEAKPKSPRPKEGPLPNVLLLAYAQFPVTDGKVAAKPGAARLEILARTKDGWKAEVIEDEESNVFHKALPFTPAGGKSGVLTLGGMAAAVKLWHPTKNGFAATTLWKESFGGRFDRMRDAEVGDLDGNGTLDIAVGTHDQGVVAALMGKPDGTFEVKKLGAKKDTFIHEVELGDLNGDGTLEIYTTPSEPNTLEGGEQHGEVVRYVSGKDEGAVVVADLGSRHAKEILVDDVDGDGRDELYVAVEALTTGEGDAVKIEEPVEIRRYDAETPKSSGMVIATVPDRFTRFLTAGDVDGDGKKEMVVAAFKSGVWLLSPGKDPRGEWGKENIDRDSSGFEHAAILADLDGDERDELYVAADDQGELRRYVFVDGKPRREVIYRREVPRSRMTWNIVPMPAASLLPTGLP